MIAIFTAKMLTQVVTQVTHRAHNFGAGPAALPEAVLKKAQAEFLDFEGSTMSVLEWTNLDSGGLSHPGVAAPGQKLQEMMLATETKLRTVLDIPSDYRILFMHGGAVAQFAAIPMNLLGQEGALADHIDSGFWSRRAALEASKYGDVSTIATYVGDSTPPWEQWASMSRKGATYLHVCLSETVNFESSLICRQFSLRFVFIRFKASSCLQILPEIGKVLPWFLMRPVHSFRDRWMLQPIP